jgi:hypothetical protein
MSVASYVVTLTSAANGVVLFDPPQGSADVPLKVRIGPIAGGIYIGGESFQDYPVNTNQVVELELTLGDTVYAKLQSAGSENVHVFAAGL